LLRLLTNPTLISLLGFFNKALSYVSSSGSSIPPPTPSIASPDSEPEDSQPDAKGLSLMDKYRLYDISLMQELSVSYAFDLGSFCEQFLSPLANDRHICDLMTENAKKMYGVTLCSSEKKDSRQRYSKFDITVVPYPGVEFFRDFDNSDPTAGKLRVG